MNLAEGSSVKNFETVSSFNDQLNYCTFHFLVHFTYKFFSVFTGMAGKIIGSVLNAGFEISGLEMFHLNTANAEEFLEVYKGVVGEYAGMVAELKSGPCIALEIRSDSPDTQKNFREFVGPADPVSFFSQLQKAKPEMKKII